MCFLGNICCIDYDEKLFRLLIKEITQSDYMHGGVLKFLQLTYLQFRLFIFAG